METENKPNKNGHIKKKALIQALEASLGVITQACKKTGIPRSSYYKWYNEDLAFKQEVDDIQNIAIDFVESQLFQQIKEGNTTATIFFLKAKAKARGYIERQEIEHSGQIRNVNVTINKNTEEENEY